MCFFFFKQKTAYEMRISDWSSDVCSSDLHAVRVFGASAYNAQEILASRDTYDLIVERGEQDKASEIGRFPRLFRNAESIPPGLVWPTMTFKGEIGRAHV